MKVDPHTNIIPGVTMHAVREVLRKRPIQKRTLVEILKLSDPEPLWQALIEGGLIERDPDHPGDYCTTRAGQGIALAKFIKRMTRKQADALVREVVERANQVNSNGDLTHYVRELRVFGSYITDVPDLGDIDLAVDLQPRPNIGDWIKASVARAHIRGKRLDFLATISFGTKEVTQILKARKARLSIHPIDDLQKIGAESRVLLLVDEKHVTPSAMTYPHA